MKTLTPSIFDELLQGDTATRLTIYLPVNKQVAETNNNVLQLKNMLKAIKTRHANLSALSSLLKPITEKLDDNELFRGHEGCIGFFVSSQGYFEILALPSCSEPFYLLDDCFYIVPLIDLLPKLDYYYILSFGKSTVKLFKGNYYGVEEITLSSEIPTTMEEALGDELTHNHLHPASGAGTGLHGYMEITDEKEIDSTRFFRIIDTALFERYFQQEPLPLILSSVAENIALFKKVSKNPFLIEDSIVISAKPVASPHLLQSLKEIIATRQATNKQAIMERFEIAKAEKLGLDRLANVAISVIDKRAEHLLIGEGKKIHGVIDQESRSVKYFPESSQDILNQLAVIAHGYGTKLHVVPSENGVSLAEGVACINRY